MIYKNYKMQRLKSRVFFFVFFFALYYYSSTLAHYITIQLLTLDKLSYKDDFTIFLTLHTLHYKNNNIVAYINATYI